MEVSKIVSDSIVDEFNTELGDGRLNKRLSNVASSIHAQPSQSFPKLFGGESEVEGFYRLLRNPVVRWEKIFAGHQAATLSRIAHFDEVIEIHDTTTFQFSSNSKRAGLGWVNRSKNRAAKADGFFGHFSLAVGVENDVSVPLGVLGLEPYRRLATSKRKSKNPRDSGRESERWSRAALEGSRSLGARKVIHVMDREADDYQLFAQIININGRFVIRARHDRKVQLLGERAVISQVATKFKTTGIRDVFLNARKSKGFPLRSNGHAPRSNRNCNLSLSAGTVEIVRPNLQPLNLPKLLTINVVHIKEENPPTGEQSIDWTLFTTEPIDTKENILKIVDIYRKRWLIEEYFKALKSGCAYEQRQLESYQTLLIALAILIPIAWNLLLMRALSRIDTDVAAKSFFSSMQFRILRNKFSLNDEATLEEALRSLARLGGHLKNNGPPGWMTIGRGYHDLLMMELGAMMLCDM